MPAGDYTGARRSRAEEGSVTLVVNILIYAGITLVPLGLAAAFIRLGRRFSSTS